MSRRARTRGGSALAHGLHLDVQDHKRQQRHIDLGAVPGDTHVGSFGHQTFLLFPLRALLRLSAVLCSPAQLRLTVSCLIAPHLGHLSSHLATPPPSPGSAPPRWRLIGELGTAFKALLFEKLFHIHMCVLYSFVLCNKVLLLCFHHVLVT